MKTFSRTTLTYFIALCTVFFSSSRLASQEVFDTTLWKEMKAIVNDGKWDDSSIEYAKKCNTPMKKVSYNYYQGLHLSKKYDASALGPLSDAYQYCKLPESNIPKEIMARIAIELGAVQYQLLNDIAAIATLDEAIALADQHNGLQAMAHWRKGLSLYFLNGDLYKSLDHQNTAYKLLEGNHKPDSKELNELKALIVIARGGLKVDLRDPSAKNDLTSGLKLDTLLAPQVEFSTARAYIHSEQYQEAISLYNSIIVKNQSGNPGYLSAVYAWRALAESKNRQNEQALADVKQAIHIWQEKVKMQQTDLVSYQIEAATYSLELSKFKECEAFLDSASLTLKQVKSQGQTGISVDFAQFDLSASYAELYSLLSVQHKALRNNDKSILYQTKSRERLNDAVVIFNKLDNLKTLDDLSFVNTLEAMKPSIEKCLAASRNIFDQVSVTTQGDLLQILDTYKGFLLMKKNRENGSTISDVKQVVTSDYQNLLRKNEAIISYFLGDSLGVALIMHSNGRASVPIPNYDLSKMKSLVTQLRDGITGFESIHRDSLYKYKPDLQNECRSKYTEAASLLFELLLRNVLASLPKEVNRLIVIPDAVIGGVPVEALLRSKPTTKVYRNFDYVINAYQISYAWSLGTMGAMHPNLQKADTSLLALSPFGVPRAGHPSLVSMHSATRKTTEYLKPSLFFGNSDATFNQLRNRAGKFENLVITTHSIGNENAICASELFLAGLNGKIDTISFKHIDSLRLGSVNSVFLASCESGYGYASSSEGLMGLGYAFTKAGATSVVQSLWPVKEMPTDSIIDKYHKGISKKENPSLALHKAKKSISSGQVNYEFDHPYYWAGFVCYGKK